MSYLIAFNAPDLKDKTKRNRVEIIREPQPIDAKTLENADLVFVEGGPRFIFPENTLRDAAASVISTAIPIAIMVIFTIIGGYVLNRCEHVPPDPAAAKAERAEYLETMRHWASRVGALCREKTDFSGRKRVLTNFLRNRTDSLPGLEDPYNWDHMGATFFASTLYTTVGYGSFAPVTFWGQFATIVYSLIGIPIFLIMLANWGKLLFRIFKWLTVKATKLFGKFCVCYRGKLHKSAQEMKRTDETALPTWLAVFLLFAWILLCASLFLIVEPEWDFFKSIYFFFISLTTIGLGDVTLSSHKEAVLTSPLGWAGLAVVSMCISILQNNLEAFMKRIVGTVETQYAAALADGADGEIDLERLKREMSWKDKILFSLMDDSKVHRIEDVISQRNNLHSVSTQTTSERVEIEVQAGDGLPTEDHGSNTKRDARRLSM